MIKSQQHIGVCLIFLSAIAASPVVADSSSPRLAAYYDRQMAIVGGRAYAWRGRAMPKMVVGRAIQVGVSDLHYFALTADRVLHRFNSHGREMSVVARGVRAFAAGASGILVVRQNRSLWLMHHRAEAGVRLASNVATAAVGDGANYYLTTSGELYVRGKAHRGQYGDGRLKRTRHFVRTASSVVQVSAHTGHALYLNRMGAVYGTGGNIYGPVGIHGLGDKADRWSEIMQGARAIATGSTHSFAIRTDGVLVGWGRRYGPKPKPLMKKVTAVASGSETVIALVDDRILWQWRAGESPRLVKLPKHR